MKKILVSLATAVMLLAIVAGIAFAATGVTDPVVLSQLAEVRQATAKFHDLHAALANGFVPTSHSDQEPGLAGGIIVKPIIAGTGVKPILGARPV